MWSSKNIAKLWAAVYRSRTLDPTRLAFLDEAATCWCILDAANLFVHVELRKFYANFRGTHLVLLKMSSRVNRVATCPILAVVLGVHQVWLIIMMFAALRFIWRSVPFRALYLPLMAQGGQFVLQHLVCNVVGDRVLAFLPHRLLHVSACPQNRRGSCRAHRRYWVFFKLWDSEQVVVVFILDLYLRLKSRGWVRSLREALWYEIGWHLVLW